VESLYANNQGTSSEGILMAKVRIRASNGVDDTEVRALLKAAGCELVDEAGEPNGLSSSAEADAAEQEDQERPDELAGLERGGVSDGAEDECASPGGAGELEDEADVLAVILSPTCVDDEELDELVTSAVRRGVRVVGVWPPGAVPGRIPRALERLGDDTVVYAMSWMALPHSGRAPQVRPGQGVRYVGTMLEHACLDVHPGP
jgi:hypothetical protein